MTSARPLRRVIASVLGMVLVVAVAMLGGPASANDGAVAAGPGSYAISGHVDLGVAGDSASAGEVAVRVRKADWADVETVTTDAAGNFVVDGLEAGAYNLAVTAVDDPTPLYQPYSLRNVEVGPDVAAPSYDIVLPHYVGGTIQGWVMHAGDGIEGVVVTGDVFSYYPETTYLFTATAVTDENGVFFLHAAAGTDVQIYFEDPSGVHAAMAWSGESFYGVADVYRYEYGGYFRWLDDVELPLAATLTGTATGGSLSSGDLSASTLRVAVQYRDPTSGEWVDAGWSWTGGSGGTFDIWDLAPGTYRFTATYLGAKGVARVTSPDLTFSAGQDLTWDPILPTPQPVVTVYRFWSQNKRSHFYTASAQERDYIVSAYDDAEWLYEGAVYSAFDEAVEGTTPLYRFWSQRYQGHFYTTSLLERDAVIANYDDAEWKYEGVAFHVYPIESDATGSRPVARFWSEQNRHHFYTADRAEAAFVLTNYDPYEWAYEGDAFGVLAVVNAAKPANSHDSTSVRVRVD